MAGIIYKPNQIDIKQLLRYKNSPIVPIECLANIHLNIPTHLLSKARSSEASNTFSVQVRQILNTTTSNNTAENEVTLRGVVSNARTIDSLKEVAEELFQNFIIGDQNIPVYMKLLNAIHKMSILPNDPDLSPHQGMGGSFFPNQKRAESVICVSGNTVSQPLVVHQRQACPAGVVPRSDEIGSGTTESLARTDGNKPISIRNLFLTKCREMMLSCITVVNMRALAELDQEDADKQDEYNRKREKIINLIITICHLYAQRNTNFIHLTAVQIYRVLNSILVTYMDLQNKMRILGNPDKEDCADEDEYEIMRKMCSLYAEQFYTFLSECLAAFNKDTTTVNADGTSRTLQWLVQQFQTQMLPTLTESFLISKCKSLGL